MNNKEDPAAILLLAWNTHRLDTIRAVVSQTIGTLHQLNPRDVLGRELSTLECESDSGPVHEALNACCEELCDECGMPESPPRSSQTRLKRQPDAAWTESYAKALERYRSAAGLALKASLDKL
jgi:hypothetical protein